MARPILPFCHCARFRPRATSLIPFHYLLKGRMSCLMPHNVFQCQQKRKGWKEWQGGWRPKPSGGKEELKMVKNYITQMSDVYMGWSPGEKTAKEEKMKDRPLRKSRDAARRGGPAHSQQGQRRWGICTCQPWKWGRHTCTVRTPRGECPSLGRAQFVSHECMNK